MLVTKHLLTLLIWPWWVRIPSEDFSDVNLAGEDTDDHNNPDDPDDPDNPNDSNDPDDPNDSKDPDDPNDPDDP